MDLKKQFAYDERKAAEGVWETMDEDSKARVLVARMSNPRYEEELQKALRPYRNLIRRNVLPQQKSLDIVTRVMSRTILLDWENLYEDGKPIGEYSEDEAYRLLSAYPDFRQYIADLADDNERYVEEDLEETGEY